jgi:hypothetical protein
MIQASIGPCRSIAGNTSSRTLASSFASDQGEELIKCINDWCCAETRPGAVAAASGSMLLRSNGSISPVQ